MMRNFCFLRCSNLLPYSLINFAIGLDCKYPVQKRSHISLFNLFSVVETPAALLHEKYWAWNLLSQTPELYTKLFTKNFFPSTGEQKILLKQTAPPHQFMVMQCFKMHLAQFMNLQLWNKQTSNLWTTALSFQNWRKELTCQTAYWCVICQWNKMNGRTGRFVFPFFSFLSFRVGFVLLLFLRWYELP